MATVKVSIFEARDLPVMDRTTGLADPYVVVKLGDMEDMTGICQKTRNPIWRKDFRFDAPNALLLQEDPLEIRVYDHDIISRDDLVGLIFFDLNSIITSQQQPPPPPPTATLGGVTAISNSALLTGGSLTTMASLALAGQRDLSSRADSSLQMASTASGGGGVSLSNTNAGSSTVASTGQSAATTTSSSSGSSNSTIAVSGWFPLYDTMDGIRGELRLTIKIKFQSPENPVAPRVPVREVRVLAPLSIILSSSAAAAAAANNNSSLSNRGSPAGVSSSFNISLRGSTNNMSTNDLLTLPSGAAMIRVSPPASPGFYRQSVDATGCASTGGGAALATVAESGGLSSSFVYYSPMIHDSDHTPLQVVQSELPTLMTEEEGVFIYSMSRLDPSLYRVEAVRGLVEELIVKADPEHSKFTTLRSSRSTNEARLLQLYKLSGKVRRLIARRATEQGCNAVLGYQEVFDMDPNGIIVRALGTTCVVSDVVMSHVVPEILPPVLQQPPQLHSAPNSSSMAMPEYPSPEQPSGGAGSLLADQAGASGMMPIAPSWMVECSSDCDGGGGVKQREWNSTPVDGEGGPNSSSTHTAAAAAAVNQVPLVAAPPVVTQQQQQQQQVDSGNAVGGSQLINPGPNNANNRQAVLVLTLTEVPSGILVHIGGLVAARSVKIVSRIKNRTSISQERDTWWQEVREEIKANSRSFHCNAIIGYKETMTYHEDAVILSCSGTAVVIDTSWLTMRTSSQFVYSKATEKAQSRTNCGILHVYSGRPHHTHINSSTTTGGASQPSRQRHEHNNNKHGNAAAAFHPATSSQQQHHQNDLNNLCELCHQKNVPEVLVVSSMLPVDVSIEGVPRLLICKAQREKPDVRGRDLALNLSQALPFLEFTLHKQLMYQLRSNRLNSAFGVEFHFAVSSSLVVATLVATGCRVVGIPIPVVPRVEYEPNTSHLEHVVKLKQVIARDAAQQQQNLARPRNNKAPAKRKKEASGSGGGTSAVGGTAGGGGGGTDEPLPARSRMPLSSTANSSAVAVDDYSSSSSDSGENDTWASSGSENDSAEDEDPLARRSAPVAEYVVYIDDAEEAVVMLGAFDYQPFPDPGFIVSIPYIPSEANAYRIVETLELIRRYPLPENSSGVGSAEYFYKSTSNAVNAFIYHALQALVAHQQGGRSDSSSNLVQHAKVFAFRMEVSFSANSEQLHFRLSGALAVSNDEIRVSMQLLEDAAFVEAERHLVGAPQVFPASFCGGGGVVSRVRFAEPFSALHRGSIGSSSTIVTAAAGGVGARGENAVAGQLQVQSGGGGSLSAAGAAADGPSGVNYNVPPKTIIRRGHRQLFVTCNAPFSFPFVASPCVAPYQPGSLGITSLFARDEAAAPEAAASLAASTDPSGRRRVQKVLEAGDRATMVRRQWAALTSLVSTTLRNATEKAGIPFLMKPGVNHAPIASSSSQGGGSTVAGTAARVQPSTAPELIFPSCRLPPSGGSSNTAALAALEHYCAPILVTPLSFSPGDVIVRLISRFSHHFIREEYHVHSPSDFNGFFTRATRDIHQAVCAMVKVLGGNALLNYAVDTHEVWDSDGTGGAFIFLTVTGHVAIVARAALRDDYVSVDT